MATLLPDDSAPPSLVDIVTSEIGQDLARRREVPDDNSDGPTAGTDAGIDPAERVPK